MPTYSTNWDWEDAFSKFGFNDGDGWNGTYLVSEFIETLGYETCCGCWGLPNYLIMAILKEKKSILFMQDANGSTRGFLTSPILENRWVTQSHQPICQKNSSRNSTLISMITKYARTE